MAALRRQPLALLHQAKAEASPSAIVRPLISIRHFCLVEWESGWLVLREVIPTFRLAPWLANPPTFRHTFTMAICERCGFPDESGFIERRVERKLTRLCASCTARPAREVPSPFGPCKPHRGDFDDWDRPLDRWGRLYRPGFRVCKHTDCISTKHIKKQNEPANTRKHH